MYLSGRCLDISVQALGKSTTRREKAMKRAVLITILTASALLLGGCFPGDVDVLGAGPVEKSDECDEQRSEDQKFIPFLI